jgi:hypothetical protein
MEDFRAYLPALSCPIPSGFHAGYEEVGASTLRWAERFNLARGSRLESLSRTDCARLGAAVHHDGYAHEALQLATDFITWLYMHDDLWVDGVLRQPAALDLDHRRLLEVLRGRPLTSYDHELAHALGDIRARLLEYSHQLEPFIASFEQYITAKSWESRNHIEHVTPPVRLYTMMRSYGGGVVACYELAVIVRPMRLSPYLRNHAYVQGLTTMSNNLVCWANDIASLAKEIEEGITTNLVMALQSELRCPWPRALERAVEMWNAEMRSYLDLARRLDALPLSAGERREIDKYVGLLGAWVRGNLDYDQVVRRFDVAALSRALAG